MHLSIFWYRFNRWGIRLDVVVGNDLNQQVLLTVGSEIDETPPEHQQSPF